MVAAFGFALQRWLGLDKRALSSVVFNCFSPCLVFSSLINSQVQGDELVTLSAFTVLNITAMGLLALAVARLLRLDRHNTVALLVVSMFTNSGNYGLTLNQIRYGNDGLSRAVIYYITSTLFLYTVGMFVASMGRLKWQDALKRLTRIPAVYAAVLAVITYTFQIQIPTPLARGIEIAGNGAIPVMLVVLGMQMADLDGRATLRLATPAVGLRLLVAPLVAVALTALLGLRGLGRATAIIEASMPAAVFNIILATEFDLHPPAVTSIVAITTLLSPLTVAATITFFGL